MILWEAQSLQLPWKPRFLQSQTWHWTVFLRRCRRSIVDVAWLVSDFSSSISLYLGIVKHEFLMFDLEMLKHVIEVEIVHFQHRFFYTERLSYIKFGVFGLRFYYYVSWWFFYCDCELLFIFFFLDF